MATLTADESAFLLAISAEAEVVRQFVEVLKVEQTSLSNGSTEDLIGFAEQKSKLAIQLNSLAAQRNTLMAAQGLGPDRLGVEAWFTKHPTEKTAAGAWAKILALAGEARELNRLNGELIGMRMQYNAKALEALQGGNNSLDLYGPDGQSTPKGYRRINHAV